jgi:DNA-binding NarL/FixJ family response regulator
MAITVIVIEDDLHYNNALKKVIDYDEELKCTGQYFRGKDILKDIAAINADIAIVDINLPDYNGIQILEAVADQQLSTQFIMCTNLEDEEYIFQALKAGAIGYLLKGESMQRIIDAIKEAHTGGAPMTISIARKVMNHFSNSKAKTKTPDYTLTATENDVLQLLAEGLLYKEIAQKKFVSIDTIKKHIGNIYRKLQVNNKIEAINKVFPK